MCVCVRRNKYMCVLEEINTCVCWKELIHVCVLEGINTCVRVGRN